MSSAEAGAAFLAGLGWSAFFSNQVGPQEAGLVPFRVAGVHRDRLTAIVETGQVDLALPPHATTGEFAVGDWVLAEQLTHLLQRRLERTTLLQRRVGGTGPAQLAGANIDTLFIVTSCNADFSPARLERYLALTLDAGIRPVIVLTKADTADDPADFARQAAALQDGLPVVTLNPRLAEAAGALQQWCGVGQTVALVGSSGVGKSTLVNTLAGAGQELPQQTGGVRHSDAKGRHTTTSRSLHAMAGGGWVIDTPGMRSLHVSDVAHGIETLFAEITALAPLCKFRDCTHAHEPGCAVQQAVAAGTLDPDRLTRWRKLSAESRGNTPAVMKSGAVGAGRRRR